MPHRHIDKLSTAFTLLLVLATMNAACAKEYSHSDHYLTPRLTTAQTPGVVHTCNKELHDYRCVKKCIVKTTEVGLPLPWYVRYGAVSPRRDKKAEDALLKRVYLQRDAQTAVVKTK